ncbi:MAG: hypothetical protein Q9171_007412 [Xanthocarpia ochracea]
MADQKQVIDLKGVGGYIRPEKLEELLAQKYGRKIKVEVKIDECYVFDAPGKPTQYHSTLPWTARQHNATIANGVDKAVELPASIDQALPNAAVKESGNEKESISPETSERALESSATITLTVTLLAESAIHEAPVKESSPSSSSKRPDAGKVVMVTASSGTGGFLGIPHMKERVYENRMSYADRHGYEHMWANISTYNLSHGEPIYWNKIPVLQEAFIRYPDVEWVWWMDMDIIITNHSLSLWDHVLSPEGMARNVVLDQMINKPGGGASGWKTPPSYNYSEVNFMIASGGWGMNIGNFLMRRSYWSEWLLDLWIDPFYIKEFTTFPENDGWTHMYRHHPIVRKHTVCTNQRALNAYPSYNHLGEHWQPGDHSVHFAGCGANAKCPARWDEYWELKEKYDVPAEVKKKLADGTAEIENIQKGIGLPEGADEEAVVD